MCNEIRTIEGKTISSAVSELYGRICTRPDRGVEEVLREALRKESPGPGREALNLELLNFETAGRTDLPICQDTGTAVVFVELGSKVCVTGGTIRKLVDEGVGAACSRAFLRPSQVDSPLGERVNTMDNTPAVVHLEHVPGTRIRISLLAKGAGSENVSRSEMLPPLSGEEGIALLAEKCVLSGASRACPPLFLGIGAGGNLEVSGILAKKALLRKPGEKNPDAELASLEQRITRRMNALGIGPQGFGGYSTVLETRILTSPCHMASLPVTVCVECHAHRTASCVI